MRAWCHWTWSSSSSSSSSKSECTYIQTHKNTTRLLRLVALCAVLYMYRDVFLHRTRFIHFSCASTRLCDKFKITKNSRKNNRLTDNDLWSTVNFRTRKEDCKSCEKKSLKIEICIQKVRRLFIRKRHKIYVTARVLFRQERWRVGCSKKKRNGRGSMGVEKQLRCITRAPAARTLRCALYFVGVIFTMRRACLRSYLARGSAVTQDMCQRRCVVEFLAHDIDRDSATFPNRYIF